MRDAKRRHPSRGVAALLCGERWVGSAAFTGACARRSLSTGGRGEGASSTGCAAALEVVRRVGLSWMHPASAGQNGQRMQRCRIFRRPSGAASDRNR